MKGPIHTLWLGLWLLTAACAKTTSIKPVPEGGLSLADKSAGKGCKRDADCKNGRCAQTLRVTPTAQTQGGYCTIDCNTDADCGLGGECAVPAGEEVGECLATCQTDRDCRADYRCVGSGSGGGLELSGSCQPKAKADQLEDGVAGKSCASDAQCAGGQCLQTAPLGMVLPGNYCSGRCYEDSQCGSGGACLLLDGSGELGFCYRSCSEDADCARERYRCQLLGPNFHGCYPAPDDLPDYTSGKACDADSDCGGIPDSCRRELPFGSLASFEVVAAPGGYCSQECSLDRQCGAGGQCISRGIEGGLCLANCNEPSDCREGYTCIIHGRDGKDDKVCAPLTNG